MINEVTLNHEKSKKMADVIESANSAYEERDKAND